MKLSERFKDESELKAMVCGSVALDAALEGMDDSADFFPEKKKLF